MCVVNDLLPRLASDLQAQDLLAPLGLEDWRGGARRLRELAHIPGVGHALSRLLPLLLHALDEAASPDRALINLERFVQGVPGPAALLARLADDPRTLEMLVTLFAGSQYLTDILLRNPAYFALLSERNGPAQTKNPDRLLSEARAAAAPWTRCAASSSTSSCVSVLRT